MSIAVLTSACSSEPPPTTTLVGWDGEEVDAADAGSWDSPPPSISFSEPSDDSVSAPDTTESDEPRSEQWINPEFLMQRIDGYDIVDRESLTAIDLGDATPGSSCEADLVLQQVQDELKLSAGVNHLNKQRAVMALAFSSNAEAAPTVGQASLEALLCDALGAASLSSRTIDGIGTLDVVSSDFGGQSNSTLWSTVLVRDNLSVTVSVMFGNSVIDEAEFDRAIQTINARLQAAPYETEILASDLD